MLSSLPVVQRGLSWQPNRPPGCAPACYLGLTLQGRLKLLKGIEPENAWNRAV